MRLDLSSTFVHLGKDGGAEPIALTPSFWRGTSRYDRVVGVFEFKSAKDLHSTMQEAHPEVDELLYVVSGAIDVFFEKGGEERTVAIDAGHAFIVSRGVWHRLVMRKPGKLLFINNRSDIQSRPMPKPLRARPAAMSSRERPRSRRDRRD